MTSRLTVIEGNGQPDSVVERRASTLRIATAGWGNAMRYILTGDHWSAKEAHRMGTVQELAPNRQARQERQKGAETVPRDESPSVELR